MLEKYFLETFEFPHSSLIIMNVGALIGGTTAFRLSQYSVVSFHLFLSALRTGQIGLLKG